MAIPEIKSYYEKEEAVKGPFTNLDKATIKFWWMIGKSNNKI